MEVAGHTEIPDAELCAKIGSASLELDDLTSAYEWILRVADTQGPFVPWTAAGTVLAKLKERMALPGRRSARVALAGSYTTAQFVPLLRLAALRRGLHLELYETGFDLYNQEILDPTSGLYGFSPDYVILAPHEGAVRFPTFTEDPQAALNDELRRWTNLWDAIRNNSSARVVQHNFALRPESALGHIARRARGSREELLHELNSALARAAGDDVLMVDCDRVAGAFGKDRWFDDRYWHLAKQAVALDALPTLARHTAAVLAAAEGLSSKCIVLDLDNTLWGGVVAEDGLDGIQLGGSPRGEAYLSFQEHLLALRSRGVLLAVASKNNERDAKEPFERHPDMRLTLDDFAVFVANWENKAANLETIASVLGLGLDALVFVDDNRAEREVVRQLLPAVEVVALPSDPSAYVRALSDSLLFELAALTPEDLGRADHYRARAGAAALRREAGSIEDFYASLEMKAEVAPFDELNLARIAQLVAKTNQFNVTTRRRGLPELRLLMEDDRYVTMYLRLRDQFVDHGLVAVLIAEASSDVLEIDTWLMSCRVIGRTVENEMLKHLCEVGSRRGCSHLRGTYIPSAKNGVVRDVFERLGFRLTSAEEDRTIWEYDIAQQGIAPSEFIESDAALAHA